MRLSSPGGSCSSWVPGMRGSQKPSPRSAYCPGLWAGRVKSGRTRTIIRSEWTFSSRATVALYFSRRRLVISEGVMLDRCGWKKWQPARAVAAALPPQLYTASRRGGTPYLRQLLGGFLEVLDALPHVRGRVLGVGLVLEADHPLELHLPQ